jgi:ergothioneine biosynthesis protein EgtB
MADSTSALRRELSVARLASDAIFRMVPPDFVYDRPIAERHRIVFYIGHLEAFDWNLLRPILDLPAVDTALDQLFAFGIDPVDGQLPSDLPSDWPRLEVVYDYVTRVRENLDRMLDRCADGPEGLRLRIHVALEHRWMHVETLGYMLHQMPPGRKIAPAGYGHPESLGVATPGRLIDIPAGHATLGLSSHASFGWDNEFAEHVVEVPRFQMGEYKVTNAEFLEFVRAGGYQRRELWTEQDWDWRVRGSIDRPAFWKPAAQGYQYRGMFGDLPFPSNWPVYVSHAEARAYAAWTGKRLPSEAEWHRAAYGSPAGERQYPWGEDAPEPKYGYSNLTRFEPAPVTDFPAAKSAWGVQSLIGTGWEWTSTLFAPFEGFKPYSFYPGYSANFFDGQHYVLKGGSPQTERQLLRRSFRNWFQPHYQYVYAGFRCAKDT